MPAALARAFGQLGDPAILKILWIAVAAAVLLTGLLTGGAVWALTSVEIPGFGWLASLLQVLGGLAAFVISLFLFPGVVGLVSSLFLDQVAEAVERRHFPALGPARRQGVAETIGTALRFLLVLVAFNLLALIVSLLVPPFSLFVFYAVNGYLLGREYFELVALRRMEPAAASEMRRRYAGWILVGGVVIAVLITIPVINLLVPVVATAFMIHVHRGLLARA